MKKIVKQKAQKPQTQCKHNCDKTNCKFNIYCTSSHLIVTTKHD